MTDARAKAVEAAALAADEAFRASDEYPDEILAFSTSQMMTSVAIAAFEARMADAGWVMVPREPTLEMLQDGYDAGRAAYRNGISGMTIDAQTRAQSYREAAIYRAMIRAAMLKGRPMDRDELVERVCSVMRPIYGCDDDATFIRCEINDPGSCSCRISARAALAIIEPAVREECAMVAERRWRDWPGIHPDDAKKGDVCDDVTACADIAAAIRAGAKP